MFIRLRSKGRKLVGYPYREVVAKTGKAMLTLMGKASLSRSQPAMGHTLVSNNIVPSDCLKYVLILAEEDQTIILKEVLANFCDYSGHKINANKMNVCFSEGVSDASGGSSRRSRKVALVGWEDVSQPQEHGSIDLQNLFGLLFEGIFSGQWGWEKRHVLARSMGSKYEASVNLIPGHSNLDLDCLLSEMVSDDDTWNLDLFEVWLLEMIVRKIIGVFPPYSTAGADKIIWGGMSTGSFSRLLTNMDRVRRGIGHNSLCEICGHISKDVLHAIRDCPAARDIWNHLIPTDNINLFSFLGVSGSNINTIKVSFSWAKQFMMTARGSTRSFQDPSSCSNLNGNWVYLNTDGSLRLENDSASAGQIVDSLEMAIAIHEGLIGGSNSAFIRRILQ
ncbi:hypothetical protein Golob_023157 [Gossypium lobatum]|uniref:Reverse transcriptase zinc-binding domain-containing protein n=1 Tax=Gossypium lobatum TaxID=34289 RepID=A0A7J8LIR1_9ROSI|nr:hypothetical protein [Gossypium lobatum]